MSRRRAGATDNPDPTPPDPRHRPVVLHVAPRRSRFGHRSGVLSVAVGTCLLLASLLAVTLVSAWAGWRVAASDPGTPPVTADPVVPRRPAADDEATPIPPDPGSAPAGPGVVAGGGGVQAAPRHAPTVRRAVPVVTVRLSPAASSSPSRPVYEDPTSAPVTTSPAPTVPAPTVSAPTDAGAAVSVSAPVDPEPRSGRTVDGRDDGDGDRDDDRPADEQDDDSGRDVDEDDVEDEDEDAIPDEGGGAD